MKRNDTARSDMSSQGPKYGDGVRKKLQYQAANKGIEGCIGRNRGHIALDEPDVTQANFCRASPRLGQSKAIAINSDLPNGRVFPVGTWRRA